MKIGKAAATFPTRPIGAMGDLASAYAGRTAATAIKEANTSDSLIANAFRNFDKLPDRAIPQMFQPRALITGGPILTPPPADTSAVTGIPADLARRDIKGLLTAGKTPIVTPPPADTSAVTAIPGEYGKAWKDEKAWQALLERLGKGKQ